MERPAKRQKRDAHAQDVREKYEFGPLVGEGAFGFVYRAAERNINSNTVAIKEFKKVKDGEGISFSLVREIAVRFPTQFTHICFLHVDFGLYFSYTSGLHDQER